MVLFTIVLDYRVGTYVRQVRARSPVAVCRRRARELKAIDIHKLGESGKEDLITRLKLDTVIGVDGLTNVWCTSAIGRGQLALIHIVKTTVD